MGKMYPRFGLNQGVNATTIEHKKSDYGESLLLELDVYGKKFWKYYGWPTHAYRDNKKTTDKAAVKEEREIAKAAIKHIFAAFAGRPAVEQAEANGQISTFKEFCEVMISLLPEDWQDRELDTFLQYQFKVKEGAARTYLELPKNIKHGDFLCSTKGRGYKREESSDGGNDDIALKYVKDGKEHPFQRNGWYMGSNFAAKQGEATVENNAMPQKEEPTQAEDDDLPF